MSRAYDVVAKLDASGLTIDLFEQDYTAPFKTATKFSQTDFFKSRIEELYDVIEQRKNATVELTKSWPSPSWIRGWQGGLVNVVECNGEKYVMFNQRSVDAPIRPGVLDISAGRCDDGKEDAQHDWLEQIIREGVEEIVTKTNGSVGGNEKQLVYIPHFKQDLYSRYSEPVGSKILEEVRRAKIPYDGILYTEITMLPPKQHAKIKIHPYENPGDTSYEIPRAGFAFEADNSSMELFMYAVRKMDLGDLKYQDTECLPNGEYLHCNTVVINARSGEYVIWKDGAAFKTGDDVAGLIKYIEDNAPADKRAGLIATEKVIAAIKNWPDELGPNNGLLPILGYHASL